MGTSIPNGSVAVVDLLFRNAQVWEPHLLSTELPITNVLLVEMGQFGVFHVENHLLVSVHHWHSITPLSEKQMIPLYF